LGEIDNKMENKRAILGIGFNWIFAIIVGGVILFLAIYGASKFISSGEQVLYTGTAAKLISLLDPATGLASGMKPAEINFKKLSKIYFECNVWRNQPFGEQTIAFSEQTFGEKYGDKGREVTIKNKYVFAEDVLEGEKIHYFIMPFFMSFKVDDIIMMSSENYCFYDSPEEVKENVESLGIKNVVLMNSSAEGCNGVKVCFGSTSSDCDLSISGECLGCRNKYEYGNVIKNGKKMYYMGDLIYAAIFSAPEIYECNVKRLKSKFDELSLIYIDKIKIIERKGCSSNIGAKLGAMQGDINSSRDLIGLVDEINSIDVMNEGVKSGCRLY